MFLFLIFILVVRWVIKKKELKKAQVIVSVELIIIHWWWCYCFLCLWTGFSVGRVGRKGGGWGRKQTQAYTSPYVESFSGSGLEQDASFHASRHTHCQCSFVCSSWFASFAVCWFSDSSIWIRDADTAVMIVCFLFFMVVFLKTEMWVCIGQCYWTVGR